jgi:hypothetical protein
MGGAGPLHEAATRLGNPMLQVAASSVQYYLVVSRRFSGLSARISAKYWTLLS